VPRIKIGKIHRIRNGAIIVPFEFDTGERGNKNFHPNHFEGMTKTESKAEIIRVLEKEYAASKRRSSPTEKGKVTGLINDASDMEIE